MRREQIQQLRAALLRIDGPSDRTRRPYRHVIQLALQIEMRIVRLKQDRAPKVGSKLDESCDRARGCRMGV